MTYGLNNIDEFESVSFLEKKKNFIKSNEKVEMIESRNNINKNTANCSVCEYGIDHMEFNPY
jgi:hypothetical protein